MLRDGRADVALLQTPFDERGLDHESLVTEPRVVLVRRSPIGGPAPPQAGRSRKRAASRMVGRGSAHRAILGWTRCCAQRAVKEIAGGGTCCERYRAGA